MEDDSSHRVAEFRKRQRAAGLMQIELWVPRDRAGEIRDLVRRHLAGASTTPASSIAATPPAPQSIAAPPSPPEQKKPPPDHPWLIRFGFGDRKIPFELRERFKRLGLRQEASGTWWGVLPTEKLEMLQPTIKKAGCITLDIEDGSAVSQKKLI